MALHHNTLFFDKLNVPGIFSGIFSNLLFSGHWKFTILKFSFLLFLIGCTGPEKKEIDAAADFKDLGTSSDMEKAGLGGDKQDTSEILQSEITCPNCNHKKMETLPTEVCLLKYTCGKCKTDLFPKEGDCCVFCSYGTHKCPSMQDI